MYDYKKTRLWEETLGVIDDPKDEFKPHEFLRTIYFTFRERAIGLSEEIVAIFQISRLTMWVTLMHCGSWQTSS